MLAEIGATAVLAETTEIFGAEHLLVKRARNREVAEKLLGLIEKYKKYLNRFGGSFDDNPSPGQQRRRSDEHSGEIAGRGGESRHVANERCRDYAERIKAPGFVFMNTPGYDPVSLTGLAAGGCNLIAFTTGRGSAIGFPTIPVIKIATNSNTYRRMRDNMDVNAGRSPTARRRFRKSDGNLRPVRPRRLRRADLRERLGHKEFVPWRIGPVLMTSTVTRNRQSARVSQRAVGSRGGRRARISGCANCSRRVRARFDLRRPRGDQPRVEQLSRAYHASEAGRGRDRSGREVRRWLRRSPHHLRHHVPAPGTRASASRRSRTWKPASSSSPVSRPTPAPFRDPQPEDHIISDELNHASIIDGCRLSKRKIHVFPHKDMAAAEQKLRNLTDQPGRKLLITDGVFSMDGDIGPLPALVEAAESTAPS